MPGTIRDYQSTDAEAIRSIYIQKARHTEFKRVAKAVFHDWAARRTWQAGIVGILSLQLTPMLMHRTAALAMCLWSTGVGVGWFAWLRSQDRRQTLKEYCTMMDRLKEIQGSGEKNNHVWVMEEEKEGEIGHKVVVGVMGFEYDKEEEEGRVWDLTGAESRIELALVKTAMQFARDNQINVLVQMEPPLTTTTTSSSSSFTQ